MYGHMSRRLDASLDTGGHQAAKRKQGEIQRKHSLRLGRRESCDYGLLEVISEKSEQPCFHSQTQKNHHKAKHDFRTRPYAGPRPYGLSTLCWCRITRTRFAKEENSNSCGRKNYGENSE